MCVKAVGEGHLLPCSCISVLIQMTFAGWKDECALSNLLYLDCADRGAVPGAGQSAVKKGASLSLWGLLLGIHAATLAKIVVISRLERSLLRAVITGSPQGCLSTNTCRDGSSPR